MDHTIHTYSVDHHYNSIICSKCGKRGTVVWDDFSRASDSGPELVGIDSAFFERIGRKPPYPVELVCRECGGVAVTAYPPTAPQDREDYH